MCKVRCWRWLFGNKIPISTPRLLTALISLLVGAYPDTVDYSSLVKGNLPPRKVTLRPFLVRGWSRYTQILDAVKDS